MKHLCMNFNPASTYRSSKLSDFQQWLFKPFHKVSYKPNLFIFFSSRNPKLRMIPSLLNDLLLINKLDCRPEEKEILKVSVEERSQENNHDHHTSRQSGPVLNQDLNCLPCPDDLSESDNELADGSLPGSVLIPLVISA